VSQKVGSPSLPTSVALQCAKSFLYCLQALDAFSAINTWEYMISSLGWLTPADTTFL
jgi:hypothetical protein